MDQTRTIRLTIILIGLALLLISCSSPNENVPESPAAICGNGIIENGETPITCCVDAGCQVGQICTEGTCVDTAACGNGIIENGETADTCCRDAGCGTGLVCLNDRCIAKEGARYVGSGVYDIGEGNTVFDPTYRYTIAFSGAGTDEIGRRAIQYSIVRPDGTPHPTADIFLVKGNWWYPMYSTAERGGAPWNNDGEGKEPGLVEIGMLDELPNNRFNVSVQFCPGASYVQATGKKKVLILPIYFDDRASEIGNHAQRERLYRDAIADIQAYLKERQDTLLGKQVLTLEFEIAPPVRAGKKDTYFSDGAGIARLVRNPQQYDIISAIFYTAEPCANDHADLHVTVDCKLDEPATEEDFANAGMNHAQRDSYTTLLLHEILHEFGMNDADGNQGKKLCYVGAAYDGTQPLSEAACADIDLYQRTGGNIGKFQGIDEFVARQIGWSDRDRNGILDAQEYCTVCRPDSGSPWCGT